MFMQTMKFTLLAMLMIFSATVSTQAKANIRVGEKDYVLFVTPIKEKVIIGLAPSAMDIFVNFMEDYFKNNTWEFEQIETERYSKLKKQIFKVMAPNPLSSGEMVHAYTLQIKPKTKRLRLKLTLTRAYLKIERIRNENISYKELRSELSKRMKEHLEDIKSYW
jgi:hypothetical protein